MTGRVLVVAPAGAGGQHAKTPAHLTGTSRPTCTDATTDLWPAMPTVRSHATQHDDEERPMTYYYFDATTGCFMHLAQPDRTDEAMAAAAGARPRRCFGEDAAAQRRMRGA
jgi:hypothetical protein